MLPALQFSVHGTELLQRGLLIPAQSDDVVVKAALHPEIAPGEIAAHVTFITPVTERILWGVESLDKPIYCPSFNGKEQDTSIQL